MKFRVTYKREYSKIVYAKNRKEAEWRFNEEADDNSEFICAEDLGEEGKWL